uniref:FAD-dependent oxidoreductase n=1 Tax=Racemicystis crocea TaxID=1707966 RepID=A0A3S5GYM6_9BACT|nr:FAD-dependent oxidoreductase [Racemicystis crocea]
MKSQRVLVIGGGLAGLAAAISAAQRGARVTLCESHAYGRDKLCGEFLSGEVAADFEALGAGDWIDALGAVPMRRAALIAARPGAREARLDLAFPGPPGRSITRRALEAFLAERARAAGVELIERAPVRALDARAGAWRFSTSAREGEVDHVICAFGKRSTLDKAMDLPRAREKPETYAAAKAYFEADPGALESDVELYLIDGGYVGLNAVEGGRIGLCALLPGEATHDWSRLAARLSRSPALARRLAVLGRPAGPLRGLYRFGFGPQRLVAFDARRTAFALLAGDAARMMPPFTGDGMAVALRSGRLAAAALEARDPAAAYQRAYQREFRARLFSANALHRLLLYPAAFAALAPLVGKSPRLVEALYALTRGR